MMLLGRRIYWYTILHLCFNIFVSVVNIFFARACGCACGCAQENADDETRPTHTDQKNKDTSPKYRHTYTHLFANVIEGVQVCRLRHDVVRFW